VLFIKIKCALLNRTATPYLRRVSMCLVEQLEIRRVLCIRVWKIL